MSDQDLPLFGQVAPSALSTGNAVAKKSLSVSELTSKIKSNLENEFGDVWVRGEISNFKAAPSGHLYFSLKDQGATVSAAAFNWNKKNKKSFELRDGLEVICRGNVSVYAPRGNYQLLVDTIEPLGAGALQLAFEQLKEKLLKEGLFEQTRKRAIPKYPSKIVVITSPQAAAVRDVLTVLKRRAPFLEVVIVPTLVQGEEASAKIIQAIRVANHYQLGEVILLTRGGGSIEDLWAFNHEELARQISQSKIPVISAVGHEIDFTISDFVSDLRAPTPSAGAEIISQHWVELRERSTQLDGRLRMALKRDLVLKRRTLEMLAAKLKSPKDRLREKSQRLDELSLNLERAIHLILERRKSSLERLAMNLNALSPLNVLSRGYALVSDAANGKVMRSAKDVKKGTQLNLRFNDGEVKVRSE
jgi:exodeoxyribonuclease VII large subunit